jgi:cell division protein FtsL
MNIHSHIIEQIPAHILAAMSAGAASVLALADVAWQVLVGQVPGPEQAGQWSFYGVLIVAVIVLFTSLASVIWWVATKGLQAFQDLTTALSKVNDTLEKQNDYFDEVAKNAVRSALTNPPHNEQLSRHRAN